MQRPGLLLATLLVAAGSGLFACSDAGKDPQGSRDSHDPAVRRQLVALFAGDHPGSDSTRVGECFADHLLDEVTTEQLESGGVLDRAGRANKEITNLDRPVAEAWTDAQIACTDFVEESTKAQVSISKGTIDQTAYAACLTDRLDEETIRAATIAALMADWDDKALADLSVAQSMCSQVALPRD